MEFYQHVPRTPHAGRVGMAGLENASTFKQPTISFENSKSVTPFPSKGLNNNSTTPFPTKVGLGGVKTGLQPRRALADISNANANNVAASGIKNVAPKTVTKTVVKKPLSVKTVRFDEDVDTCTRVSKFRATPYKPEVEQMVKSVSNNWYQEYCAQEELKHASVQEISFAEFEPDAHVVEDEDAISLAKGDENADLLIF